MAEKLNIAHVNLAKGFRGGERQTELLIRALDGQASQTLICRRGSPLIEHLQDLSSLRVIALAGREVRNKGHIRLGRGADIVQAHETHAAHWAFLHHVFYRTPYVITRRVPEKIRNNAFNRRLYRSAAGLVGISSVIAEQLRAFKPEVAAIPSVSAQFKVDPETVQTIRAEYPDAFIIGQAGALVDRHKGQSVLIEAVRLVKDQIPNLQVLFLGSGADEARLKEMARDLRQVHFLGFKQNVADYISALDLFVFPSFYEGLGSVLLDVMACSTPVIASRTGGIPDIVAHEQSGLLIEPGDAAGLAAAILRIHADAALRSRLIAGGLKQAQTHTPQHMAGQYLKLYRSLL